MSTLWRFDDRRGSIARETDISAECAPTEENPWVPRADEDQGRAEGVETPAGQGAQTADRLTGRFPRHERLTTGSDFQALFQRGKRVDRPSMTILWCESVDARRVGFAPEDRSEEHTSELQSQSNLVCRLLLEKKNT